MDTFGARIKRYRDQEKWSQEFVADKVGISRVAITKIESGDTENPKLDTLVGLRKLYGVSYEELLEGRTPAAKAEPVGNQNVINELRAEYATAKTIYSGRVQACLDGLSQLPDDSPILAAIELMLAGLAARNAPDDDQALGPTHDASPKPRAARLKKYKNNKTGIK